ncbi:MAG: tetratricopeptide repeat protein [Planctomycetaceae bacterium]
MNAPLRTLAPVLACLLLAALAPDPAAGQRRRRPTRRVNPTHERYKTQADQAYRKGDYKRAVELTSAVIRENRSDHVAYYLRGSARAELALAARDAAEMRRAIADAREAIRLDDTRNAMYFLPYLYGMTNLTVIENRREHAKTAVAVAGQILRVPTLKNEDRANLYYQRGNTYLVLEDYDKAVADFQSAIKVAGKHLAAHLGMADAYSRAGQFDQAEARFDATVKTFPDNPLVYNNRGMFLQQRGKLSRAIIDFTRALDLDKNYFYAYTNRGFSLLRQGNAAAAEADFTKSLAINKNQRAAYSLRATARMAQDNLKGALEDNRAALALSMQSPQSHADLGFTLFFSGKYEGALASFDAALKLDKNQRQLGPWRFLVLETLGRKKEALRTFADDIATPDKNRDWVKWLLGYLGGKVDEKALIAAVHQKDDRVRLAQLCEAHFFLAVRRQIAGDNAAARKHYRQALATKQQQLSAYQGARLAERKLAGRSPAVKDAPAPDEPRSRKRLPAPASKPGG